MTFDDEITAYFEAKGKLHAGFGYEESWVEIPMEDKREMYWMIVGDEGGVGKCVYSPKPFTAEDIISGKTLYSGLIYTQRFLSKWVYRTQTHVMAAVDTRTDGNKYLMIFDATRECTDKTLRTVYMDHWG